MIQYADLAGNAFVVRQRDTLTVLRPDWVKIVGGSNSSDMTIWDPSADVLAYVYQPGGPGSGEPLITYLPEEVAHFAPVPDPEARFRGMSWLTPVVREVMADKAATDHKLMFFENGATPQMVVKLDVPDLEKFKRWMEHFRNEHEGASQAYKTMYLGAGADATVVGADLRQLDFKITQGGGETRIAAAAGVPPVIVGLSEGLQAATYSNYSQARRAFSDVTLRDLWADACGTLEQIVTPPSDRNRTPSKLWYDEECISFLQDDELDRANIFAVEASSFKSLIDGGVTADSAAAAVAAKDITLVEHTGLFSVQLQEPGTPQPEPAPPPANGNGNGATPTPAAPRYSDLEAAMREAFRSTQTQTQTVVPAPNIEIQMPEFHTEIHLPEQGPPNVTFDERAIEVTVAPPNVTFDERAIEVTVEGAKHEPPVVNVTVEPADVHLELPARKKTVELPNGDVVTITEEPDDV